LLIADRATLETGELVQLLKDQPVAHMFATSCKAKKLPTVDRREVEGREGEKWREESGGSETAGVRRQCAGGER
jgi:hypothetical protein